MNSRPFPDYVHLDHETESHMRSESREYGITDSVRQLSNKIIRKIHSKKYIPKNNNDEFSNKNMEETRPVTDEGDFGIDSTEAMEEVGKNVKSESLWEKRNEIEGDAQERYKRYVAEIGTYMIPGMEPDYFQSNNGIGIKNSLWRRNRGDRLQKLARISKHEDNIHTSLYEPHHHVNFEDMNEGFPVISSDEHVVHPFPRGGIYIRQGGELSEERNKDYDYVDKDENVYEEDENVSSEPEHFHGPTEYFETLQTSRIVPDEKFAGYGGELSEAEMIALAKPSKQEEEQGSSDEDDDKVIQEQGPTDEEDHKIKAATTRRLNTYYTEIYKQDSSDEGEDFEGESGVIGKYKTDIKKKTSNRRKAEERNRMYSDKVISKMAHHISNNPDSSILRVKTEKDAINENDIRNNEYDGDTYVPAEEVEITRNIHNIKESFTENHDKNVPSINEEYYHEGSHSSRTRRQGKENSKKINQRNDLQSTEDDDQDSYHEKANHEPSNNRKISTASQGHTRQSKERARKISHKVIYSNSNEDDNSLDTRKNYSKQKSKNIITQTSSQRRAEDSNEDDESESESSERSQQYNAKSMVHNQKVNHKNYNSHEQTDSTEVSENDNKQKVMKTYSRNRKYERAAYQHNVNNGKNVDEVSESAATVKGHNPTESIIPSYRNKSSRRALNNTYRTNTETGNRATERHVSSEEQSEEELYTKYRKRKHTPRTEVTSNGSEEMPEINEEQEESIEGKIMENKSRQKNQVIMRMSTSNKELRHRVRRDVPSQLPMMETFVRNRRKRADAGKGTSQKKYTELEIESDPINAKLQMKPHNIKENKRLQIAYRTVPTAKTVKPHGDLEWYNRIISSEDNKQMNADQSTENYISLKKHEESSDEYEHKISNNLLDKYDDKENKEDGTNQKYWKFRSDGSLEYFLDPEQLQNEGNTKREIATSLMFEPSNDITISGSMEVEAAVNTERGLRTGSKMANSVEGGERGESPMDVSFGKTMLPARSVAVLMDKQTQQTGMMSHEAGITNVDRVENIHKNQNDALNMKLYEEELDEPQTGSIRLPKAIATHILLQHDHGKVTTGGNEYKLDLLSNKEKHNKNIENRIMTDEETGKPVVWNMDIPMKMDQEVHADENGQLPFGVGQHRPEKSNTSSEQDEQEVASHVAEQITKHTAAILPFGDDMASKHNPVLDSSVKLYKSNSESNDATSTESSESRVGSAGKKIPVIDDIRSNIHSIIDKIGTTVMKASHDIKDNKNNDETVGNLKSLHSKVIKAEDKIFKITHDMMNSRSAEQSSVDGDPDNKDLAELKTKNGPEQEHPVHGADGGLENIPHFMDDNFTISSNENGTDGTHDKLEDFVTNNIADDEHTADPLVRNAKDIGHLKHIAGTREILNHNALTNANEHIKLQLSTLAKKDQIKAELEKKHLERLHALTAQRAKLKDDLLKIKAKATEGKLKLAHHIRRRDTIQDEEHVRSLMSDSETNISHAPVSIQNEIILSNYARKDNPSTESQNFRETDSDSNSNTGQSNGKYFPQGRYRQLELTSSPVSMMTNMRDIQVPAFHGQQIYKTPHYSESKTLPMNYISDGKSGGIPFIMLYDKDPVKNSTDPDKENVSQKYNLNSSPDQSVAEDASVEDQYVEIKQLSLPQFIPKFVLNNDPTMVQFQSIPTSENNIRFFLDSEKDEVDDNDRDTIIQSAHTPLHGYELDEVEPSTLRMSGAIKNINKHNAVPKNNVSDKKRIQNFILQPLTDDFDSYSELIPGSGNLHTVSIRSKRALPHLFNDKFNDDLLKSPTMTSKDKPRNEDNMNSKYWPQSFLENISTTLGKEGKNEELISNMYDYVMMPLNNNLITSNLASESNMLSDMEEFQHNPDSIPTNSLHVTNIKPITDDATKDFKYVSDENSEANQTHLEILGNNLNDIINVEADEDTENENKIKDGLSETSNEVNLHTNEINKHFRTSDSFVKSKHDNSINKAENEEDTSEMKGIPHELHKHVLNSNYEPRNSKIRKYLYPHEYKLLAASSEGFPSTKYSSTVNKLGNRSSPDETRDASKKIFSITLEEFPNINSKSAEISETIISHNTTNIAEELPKIATEYKDISDVPISNTIMTNMDTNYFIGPDVNKQGKESFIISQTYPQDNLNYLFRSMKNVAALEEKAVDTATISNSEKRTERSDVADRNTEHVEIPGGQEDTDNIKEEKKPTSTTGYIHRLFKNISNHVVKFFHSISPWNYFNR